MINPVKEFFLFCSGASRTILGMNGCEVEHGKYAGIGATIFFTATLAALSGGYAMFTAFRQEKLAIIFGLLWGLIIFNLDRFIVSSIKKQRMPGLHLNTTAVCLSNLSSPTVAGPKLLRSSINCGRAFPVPQCFSKELFKHKASMTVRVQRSG